MIDARLLRDIGLATMLALPTLSLTRPVAAESLRPAADSSPIATDASLSAMTTPQRRTAIFNG